MTKISGLLSVWRGKLKANSAALIISVKSVGLRIPKGIRLDKTTPEFHSIIYPDALNEHLWQNSGAKRNKISL